MLLVRSWYYCYAPYVQVPYAPLVFTVQCLQSCLLKMRFVQVCGHGTVSSLLPHTLYRRAAVRLLFALFKCACDYSEISLV